MKKNVAGQSVAGQLATAADGSAFTGAVTVYVTCNAGTQAIGAVGAGACTHKGNGTHTYAPAQAETDCDHVVFTFIGSGAVPAMVQTYPTFPQTGDNFARDIPTALQNADALLARDIGSGTNAGTLNERTVRSALRFIRNFWNQPSGVLTVRCEDDTTVAWTGATTNDPAAVPITGMNPT